MTIDSHQQVNTAAAELGFSRIALVVTLALLVAGIAVGIVWFRSQGAQPASSRTPAQPSTAPDPAQAPVQPPVTISEATKVGAASDPAFQKPQVATDPSFAEARGRLLPEIADFPTYPNATLVGSAQQNRPAQPVQGYRIKWTTSDPVPAVMSWYEKALTTAGWKFMPPQDGSPAVEQIARISKGGLAGYVAAEAGAEVTEIVVSLKKQ
jgi:hypothetical protein